MPRVAKPVPPGTAYPAVVMVREVERDRHVGSMRALEREEAT